MFFTCFGRVDKSAGVFAQRLGETPRKHVFSPIVWARHQESMYFRPTHGQKQPNGVCHAQKYRQLTTSITSSNPNLSKPFYSTTLINSLGRIITCFNPSIQMTEPSVNVKLWNTALSESIIWLRSIITTPVSGFII